MSDELTEFTERLGNSDRPKRQGASIAEQSAPPTQNAPTGSGDTSQWAILGNGTFMGVSATRSQLPSAVYGVATDNQGNLLLVTKRVITDELVILPDTASERVLKAVQVFWDSRDKFEAMGQLFKRGIMMWGPPGGGKTATLMLLSHDIIKRDGIVVVPESPSLAQRGLELVRRIEPDRPLICVLEDIDEIIERYSEHELLAVLDGETQINNVCFIATTNYPERLDKRIVNRPSRFDEIIKIGMPTADARKVYLRSRLSAEQMSEEQMNEWVSQTNGFSIAHLKELVIAVFCLGRTAEETLERLRKMSDTIKSDSGRGVGFNSNATSL